MNTLKITLTGASPILFRRCYPEFDEGCEDLTAWMRDPANKELVALNDDRFPSWRWQAALGRGSTRVGMLSFFLCVAFGNAAKKFKQPDGRSYRNTVKACLVPNTEWFDFTFGPDHDRVLTTEELQQIRDLSYHDQSAWVRQKGFALSSRRFRDVCRVRVRFDDWQVTGTFSNVYPERLPVDVLQQIVDDAGKFEGLLDWRPGSPQSPGTYGTFTGSITVL